MRGKVIVRAAGLLFVVVAFAGLSPADAGEDAPNTFSVVKVVEGPAPAGAVFEVEVTCVALGGSPAEGVPPTTFQFDEDGNPIGPSSIEIGGLRQCTATETVTNGADVSYACAVAGAIEGPIPDPVSCVDDQTVRFVEIGGAEGTVTVTNAFDELPPPDVEPDDDTPDAAPDVVDATPSFTG